MGRWRPCKRRDFIKKLRHLGFESPEPGGRHFYMRHGTYTLTLPGNKDYSVAQLMMLIDEIQRGTGRQISADDWNNL